ncbi:MAG: hypothetical protein GY855_03730 [candidate division Zixibacteria bacterium]|nr:hypothetical protein [candidate division Zixibacteria bacterium]
MAYIDFRDPTHWRPKISIPKKSYSDWKLTALLFFDPKFSTSDDLIDLFDFLHTFSGEDLAILVHGCTPKIPEGGNPTDCIPIQIGEAKRYYSSKTLKKDVETFEENTSWRFSMEIDVILVNRRTWSRGAFAGEELDLDSAMVLNIFRMLRDKKITSYSSFFGELIRFSKDYSGDDPAWDFSDQKLWKELKLSLFESFRKYIGFRKFQYKVEDYAINNLATKD